MKYAILGQYLHGKELGGKDICFIKYLYLGCKGEYRIYTYESEPTENTLLFDSKEDANAYIKAHKLNRKDLCCTKKHIVTEIEYYEEG